MAQGEWTKWTRLTKGPYAVLCQALVNYTRLAESERPALLTFRALRTPRVAPVIEALKYNLLTPVNKYTYTGTGPGAMGRMGDAEWFYLTGNSVPIIEWWMELGYDYQDILSGNFPPWRWKKEYDSNDEIPYSRKHRPYHMNPVILEYPDITGIELIFTGKGGYTK